MNTQTDLPAKPMLSVKDVCWSVKQHDILKNISFGLSHGEFVGLIGPNGAGKSSLMRCCYRACKPQSGVVEVNGIDIWQHSLKRNAQLVGVILQEHAEQSGLVVRDVIEQGLTPHKRLFEWDTPDDRRLVSDAVEALDLADLYESEYRHLSGGEKQRVMLARAIVQRPELLIMDEPTNHLDIHYQIDLMKKVKSMGLTVLASFHDLNLAAAYCSRLLVLNKGELVADGCPERVLTKELLKDVFQVDASVQRCDRTGCAKVMYEY